MYKKSYPENNDLGEVDVWSLQFKKVVPMYASVTRSVINHRFLLNMGFNVLSVEEGLDLSTGCRPGGNPFSIITYKDAFGRKIVWGLMGYTYNGKQIKAETTEEFLSQLNNA